MRVGPVLVSALFLVGDGAFAQTTTRVSVGSSGAQADGDSRFSASLSADGRFEAFISGASNLVPGDVGSNLDAFARNRLTGTTERVSVNSGGTEGDWDTFGPLSISAEGRFVVFASGATNLVAGDTNNVWDIFVRDRQLGTTERVSTDSAGAQGNLGSGDPWISADGRFVAFDSGATNLVPGDTNGVSDVFVHDRQTGQTRRVSVDSAGGQGNAYSAARSISADGRYVAFSSNASNLVSGDINGVLDVFVRDRLMGTTELVSISSAGVQGTLPSSSGYLSADGRYVAFVSDSSNLVAGDTNGCGDVFVRDRQNQATERASLDSSGIQGNGSSSPSGISADGRYVAFSSSASNLFPGDSNQLQDAFLHDRITGLTQRVSVDSWWAEANGESGATALSADGLCVGFTSQASNLVPGDSNNCWDVFVRDWTCTGAVSAYCTAKTNSLGCIPSIGSLGLPSQSGSDNFYVTASNVLNNKLGMMLWATAPASNPFGGGTLCLHSPIVRTPAQNSGGSPTGNDCTGSYAYHFTQGYMIQQLLGAYTTVYAQWWSRDPGFAVPNNIGLTNGLSFTICP
jgi:Tol biopolymer transport system component